MLKKIEVNPILSIVVIGLLLLIPICMLLDVSIMEARNFITAREILEDSNWLLTTMNGEPRYQKPPLPTWLAAISAMFFGIKNILALRFPGIIMVIVTGIMIYKLSLLKLKERQHSLINALITTTSFYVIAIVIEAPWDIFAHGFMLVAIYYLFQLFEKDKADWKSGMIAATFIGFSLMCKGPVSLYVLLLPFLIAYGFTYKYKYLRKKWILFFFILIIALSIGGWWYIYVRLEDPETFLKITNKETSNWSSYHVRPFYYYWSFFTQSGIWTIPAFISLIYPYMKSRVSNLKAYKFSFYWTIFLVILLSIIPEKKPRYLMPVLLPLSINIGFYIDYLIRNFKHGIKNKKEIYVINLSFGLIAIIAFFSPLSGFLIKEHLNDKGVFLLTITALTPIIISIFMFIQLKRKHIKSVFFLCVLFIVNLSMSLLIFSKFLNTENNKPASSIKYKESLKIYAYDYAPPEVVWNFGDKIPLIKKGSTINFPKEDRFGLLVLANEIENSELKFIKEKFDIEFIDSYDFNTVIGTKGRLKGSYFLLSKNEKK